MRVIAEVPITEILELRRRTVDVDPGARYREIGVRSFARGLFLKDPVSGHELGAKRVFRIELGDLVVSNIFAWEGAVAVAGEAHRATIGSHRFMTWVPSGEADVAYLMHYFASDAGLTQLRSASPGSAGRNRTLSIKNFEAIRVPLPDLPEQRRIAAHLTFVEGAAQRLHREDVGGCRLGDQVLGDAFAEMANQVRLGDLLDVNPKPIKVDDDDEVLFVPMAAVSDVSGTIAAPEHREKGTLASGYKQALPGDLIFARITPCMQNGKSAVIPSGGPRVAYGSTEFHVLRGEASVIEWVHLVVRSRWFTRQAEASFTGTAGQQRVPASFLRDVSIPVPDDIGEAVEKVRRLNHIVRQHELRASQRNQLAQALLPSARNEVFNSLR